MVPDTGIVPRRERFDKGDDLVGQGVNFLEVSRSRGFLRGRLILYKYSPDLQEARINSQLPEEEKNQLRGEIAGRFPNASIKELADP